MFLIHTDNQVDVIWRFDSSLADQDVWSGRLLLTLFAHAILKVKKVFAVLLPSPSRCRPKSKTPYYLRSGVGWGGAWRGAERR